MKLYLTLAIFLICSLGRARVIYVSSSTGNDTNNGTMPSTPLRTIKKALQIGDTVYIKSGDVYYESFMLKNKFLFSYGEGGKPVISGYKRIKTAKWVQIEPNVWRILLNQSGYDGFETRPSSFQNNIGCIHEYDTDKIHGRKLQYRNQLKENWDFWQTENFKREETKPSDYDTLYLYLEKSPNELKLEFSVGTTGMSLENSAIENIRIEGFGCHGIAGRNKSVVRNCEIDGIGGMTQIGYQNYVCLGNGIEFYVSENIEDCLVEKCKVSRCYDCGITIQGGRCGQATPRNIEVRDNVIVECCQGWEDFLNNDDNVVYLNCIFEDNIVINSGGNAGFGYPSRFKYCHVLGNSLKGFKGMIIRNNTFVGGNFYIGGFNSIQYKSNIWENNLCYIKRGDFILSNYVGKADVIRIPIEKGKYKSLKAATNAAILKYREMTGDMTTRFVIEKEGKLNRRMRKLKKKYL